MSRVQAGGARGDNNLGNFFVESTAVPLAGNPASGGSGVHLANVAGAVALALLGTTGGLAGTRMIRLRSAQERRSRDGNTAVASSGPVPFFESKVAPCLPLEHLHSTRRRGSKQVARRLGVTCSLRDSFP